MGDGKMHLFKPQPDEVAWSYKERLRKILGASALHAAMDRFDARGTRHIEAAENRIGALSFLSNMAGMTLDQFVAAHTLIPFTHIDCADTQGTTFVQALAFDLDSTGLRSPFRTAFMCPECNHLDRSSGLGFSYWRRRHQLPGIYFCQTHRVGLRNARHISSGSLTRADVLDRETPCLNSEQLKTLSANSAVQRYIDLAQSVLEKPRPIQSSCYISRLNQYLQSEVDQDSRTKIQACWMRNVLAVTSTACPRREGRELSARMRELRLWASKYFPQIAPAFWMDRFQATHQDLGAERVLICGISAANGPHSRYAPYRVALAALLCEDTARTQHWFDPSPANAENSLTQTPLLPSFA